MASFFLNPWMLVALAAVSLPIIIEWLFRRRKRRVELPTIRFLLRTKQQEIIKRQNRILLFLRMAGIFLVVLAVARPLIRHGLMGATRERHIVVLLDGTASMNQQVGVTTSFGVAQKRAAAMLRALPEGTRATVVLLSDGVEPVVEASGDLHTAAARVETLRAGSGAARMSEALAWISDYLTRTETGRPEVYVFSDFQRYTWLRPGTSAGEAGAALAHLVSRDDVFLLDVGGAPTFNYMVTDLRPEEWMMSAGMPVRFRAQVEAWGTPPEGTRATVTFLVDGVKKDVREVALTAPPDLAAHAPPGARAPLATANRTVITFEHRFAHPGEYLVEAVLEGDEHRVDNRRSYLATVPENVGVLILDESAPYPTGAAAVAPAAAGTGAERPTGPLGLDSAYLALAISPPIHPGMEKVSRFAARVVHASQVDYENLEQYVVVVLTDTDILSETMAAKLENYVADGGALWLFAGPRVNLYDYNKFLFKEGRGLLPARLVARVTAEASPPEGAAGVPAPVAQPPPAGNVQTRPGVGGPQPDAMPYPRFGSSGHPALAALTGGGDEDARFLRYLDLEIQPDARVVLTLSNGAPAMVERPFGRGTVLLCGTTAGVDWTYLPATREFPILVQELMRYLVGNPDRGVNLEVGDRFEEPVFISAQHLLLRLPDGRKERLTPRKREGRENVWMVTYDQTHQQGVYTFTDVMPETVKRPRFVVNQKSAEGDMSRLSQGEVRDALGGGWRWIGPEVPLEDFVAALHTVTELAPGILWGLLVILAAESLAAARFGRRRGVEVRPGPRGARVAPPPSGADDTRAGAPQREAPGPGGPQP